MMQKLGGGLLLLWWVLLLTVGFALGRGTSPVRSDWLSRHNVSTVKLETLREIKADAMERASQKASIQTEIAGAVQYKRVLLILVSHHVMPEVGEIRVYAYVYDGREWVFDDDWHFLTLE